MSLEIREVASDLEWDEVLTLMVSVYVDGNFVDSTTANQFFSRVNLDGQGLLLVAIESFRVVGGLLLLHRTSRLHQVASDLEAEFRMLGVDPNHRGAGVGEALVRDCLGRARASGATGMVLSTQPTMSAAHRLYERLGFVRAPERDWERAPGQAMLVYTLAL